MIVSFLKYIVVGDEQQYLNKTTSFEFSPGIHKTRNVSRLIQPYQNTFLIEPKIMCRRKIENESIANQTMLLIMVCSAVQNFKQRKTIRETWAKDTNWLQDVKVIFMLGSTHDEALQNSVLKEAAYYKDIVQSSHLDTYADLAIKSLMLLKWFLLSCKGKTEDFRMISQFRSFYNI